MKHSDACAHWLGHPCDCLTKPICIYHGNCADGFGSAWVVHAALGAQVQFHAGVYNQPPPDVAGRDVFIVDFSYKRAVLMGMAAVAKSITILDHHKTALEDLTPPWPANIAATFCMTKSGAMLTWEHFHGVREPPQLIKHIQDRDLWTFALPGTREIQANVFSYPYDFTVWDDLMARPAEDLIAEGRAIERKHFKDIAELTAVTERWMVIGGHKVPIANLPYTLVSDAANAMARGQPFAGCYWDTPKGRVFGLRSKDDGLDVSEIAKQYGGGGHAHAAGFTVSYDTARSFEINQGVNGDES